MRTYVTVSGDSHGLVECLLTHAKVLDRFAGVPLAPEEKRATAGGCPQSELVQGQRLSTSTQDALFCTASEAESGHRYAGELDEADVIGDGSDDDDGLSLVAGRRSDLLHDSRKGDRRAVDLGHEETFEDDFIEVGICAPSQETIEL